MCNISSSLVVLKVYTHTRTRRKFITKISKNSKIFLKLLSIIVYLTTFFALSLSLFRAVVGGGGALSLSLSRIGEERFIFER